MPKWWPRKPKADDKMMKIVQDLKLEFNRERDWRGFTLEWRWDWKSYDSTRNSNKSLTRRFKQAKDRVLGCEDKIEDIGKIIKEYDFLKKHRKGTYRKCGHHEKMKSLNYRHIRVIRIPGQRHTSNIQQCQRRKLPQPKERQKHTYTRSIQRPE